MAIRASLTSKVGLRRPAQWLSAIAVNIPWLSPVGKYLCIPVLNCYSCPIAAIACPIGSLTAFAMLRRIPFYILGLLALVAISVGRLLCGWACPIGLLQDYLYKIRTRKWRLPRIVDGLKYVLLIVLVVGLPFLLQSGLDKSAAERISGAGTSYDFCSLVCPAGTLEAGVPYRIMAAFGVQPDLKKTESTAGPANKGADDALDGDLKIPGLGGGTTSTSSWTDDAPAPAVAKEESAPKKAGIGWRFPMKLTILVAVLLLVIPFRRAFCRGLCPLGALMALLSKVSILRLSTDREKCTKCGLCKRVCSTDSRRVPEADGQTEATMECVLCLDCVRNCPESGALSARLGGIRLSVSRGRKGE